MKNIRKKLAPNDILRAGINLGNFLLVSDITEKGEPVGVSPDLAKEIASKLQVECQLIPFDRPGELADAVNENIWDIGNIAYEPERAESISFSDPYVLIDANFLVKSTSNFRTNIDVDQPQISIAVAGRSAYDLWLTENFKCSKIIRTASIDESHDLFKNGGADVLAGLKPKLFDELNFNDDYLIIEKPFTQIKQSVGVKKEYSEVLGFLNKFIFNYIKQGFLSSSLKKYKVDDKLSLPFS